MSWAPKSLTEIILYVILALCIVTVVWMETVKYSWRDSISENAPAPPASFCHGKDCYEPPLE